MFILLKLIKALIAPFFNIAIVVTLVLGVLFVYDPTLISTIQDCIIYGVLSDNAPDWMIADTYGCELNI